ncbi:MAG: hypothetical protein KDB00_06045, partial [Planctomycetales bacterium]|nr:hypothetical protein [Planctomycetales bacterium]
GDSSAHRFTSVGLVKSGGQQSVADLAAEFDASRRDLITERPISEADSLCCNRFSIELQRITSVLGGAGVVAEATCVKLSDRLDRILENGVK